MRSRTITLILATGAILAAAAPAALAAKLPKVPVGTGDVGARNFKVRPPSIIYTGDGSGFFSGKREANHHQAPLHWSSWTTTGASGSGFNWLDNCKPDCAQGTYHLYPVKLRLVQPKHEHGRFVFTRIKVTYTGSKPSRVHHRRQTWKLVYSAGTWSWSFPIQ